MPEEIEARVARLEVQQQVHTRDLAKLETRIDHKLDLMSKDIRHIIDGQSKQRGFWAGVTFLASIIGFILSQAWNMVKAQ